MMLAVTGKSGNDRGGVTEESLLYPSCNNSIAGHG